MPVQGGREGTTTVQAERAVRGDNGDGALSEAEVVRRGLATERLNRTVSLPECLCIRQPRIVSYAEVGDPNGIVVSSTHATQKSVSLNCYPKHHDDHDYRIPWHGVI